MELPLGERLDRLHRGVRRSGGDRRRDLECLLRAAQAGAPARAPHAHRRRVWQTEAPNRVTHVPGLFCYLCPRPFTWLSTWCDHEIQMVCRKGLTSELGVSFADQESEVIAHQRIRIDYHDLATWHA